MSRLVCLLRGHNWGLPGTWQQDAIQRRWMTWTCRRCERQWWLRFRAAGEAR